MRKFTKRLCREGRNEGLGTFTNDRWGPGTRCECAAPAAYRFPASQRSAHDEHDRHDRARADGGRSHTENPRERDESEGAFLVCSCWMADCLNLQGRSEVAVAQFERVLAVRNDLGLLSEDTTCSDAILPAIFLRRLRIWRRGQQRPRSFGARLTARRRLSCAGHPRDP